MSEERNEEYFQQFVGMDINTSIYRIKGKNLSAYATAIGDTNPKYHPQGPVAEGEKPDFSEVVAHPAYAATYTIPGLFDLADVKDEKGDPMIKNIGKLLHTGQAYDFSGCEPILGVKQKVYTSGKVAKITIKSGMLWLTAVLETWNKEKTKKFCTTTLTAGIRKGGF
jgi:MaoC dehydratase-like protein